MRVAAARAQQHRIADVIQRRAVLPGRQRAVGGTGEMLKTHRVPSDFFRATLKRFRAKWTPVRVKKTRQNKKIRASVLIQSEPGLQAQVPRAARSRSQAAAVRLVQNLQALEKLHESFANTNVPDITALRNPPAAILDGAIGRWAGGLLGPQGRMR